MQTPPISLMMRMEEVQGFSRHPRRLPKPAYLKMSSFHAGSAQNGFTPSSTWLPWWPMVSVTCVNPGQGKNQMVPKQGNSMLTHVRRKPWAPVKIF